MVVEVMGRHAGWIAVNSGFQARRMSFSFGAPFGAGKVCDHIVEGKLRGQRYFVLNTI